MLRGIAVFVRIVLIIGGLSDWAEAPATTLVRDGRPAAVIVTAKDSTPAARLWAMIDCNISR
jgi:hypothetical protein